MQIDYSILLSGIAPILTAVIGYKTGKRNRENEANRTAFEAYNFAIESLRKEFEARIAVLQQENEELRKQIKELQERKKNEK